MVANKFVQLMRKVEEKTTRGEIAWEATAEESIYQATLSMFVIRIAQNPGDGGPDYILSVADKQNCTVDSASNLDFPPEQVQAFKPYQMLKDIFETARRMALGADTAIDNILSELDAGFRILKAVYGAGNNLKDVTKILVGKIESGRLTVVVSNETFGEDPTPGFEKHLDVTYLRSGQKLSKTVKEKETLTLP